MIWPPSGSAHTGRYLLQHVQSPFKFYTRNYPIRPEIAAKPLQFSLFQQNGISHSYKLGQSISVLKVMLWYFSFSFKFKYRISKQRVETQVRRCVMQHLTEICTAYAPQKRLLCLIHGLSVLRNQLLLLIIRYIIMVYVQCGPGLHLF